MMEKNNRKSKNKSKLWTSSFAILIIGSFISLSGAEITDMVFSLMILEMTDSAFFYSAILALSNLIGIIVPLLTGRWVEKRKKEKVVYSLDFISAGLYLLFGFMATYELVSPEVIVLIVVIDAAITEVYSLAYGSLLPAMIPQGEYTRAYSVVSVLSNICEAAGLIGAFGYYYFGADCVFYFCAVCFFISAIFETKMKPTHNTATYDLKDHENVLKTFIQDSRDVFCMVMEKTGFPELMICNMVDAFRTGVFWAMALPFLQNVYHFNRVFGLYIDQEYVYILILTFYSLGQFWSGVLCYRLNMSGKTRYYILIASSLVETISLTVFPVIGIVGSSVIVFLGGIASIFSLCCYETVTFEQVPVDMRARFSGISACAVSIFTILGNLVGGMMMDTFFIAEMAFVMAALPEIIIMGVAVLRFRKNMLYFYGLPPVEEEYEEDE